MALSYRVQLNVLTSFEFTKVVVVEEQLHIHLLREQIDNMYNDIIYNIIN